MATRKNPALCRAITLSLAESEFLHTMAVGYVQASLKKLGDKASEDATTLLATGLAIRLKKIQK